jgi:hypothetical protein
MKQQLFLFFLYFFLSTILTWGFVTVSPLYISDEQLMLSTAVAGGKWAIQILLGLLFLKEKALVFLKHIGYVCFIGSVILVPYIICGTIGVADTAPFFIGSLAGSVATMIFLYYRAVRKSNVSLYWWGCWLVCLATAITLQLTVVFGVI